MACKSIQSNSSSQMIFKYDVFVSFRGEDTRNNFTDHLFGALHRKGVFTFRDDTKLKKGESMSSELIQAIESSRILIVVFSKNYASSRWCLQELAEMVDCIEVPGSGQSILPIFYDVDPSEVRKQSGSFRKAFAKHEKRFNLEMVQSSSTSGRTLWLGCTKSVSHRQIEKIVKEVKSRLGHKFLNLPNDLVGLDSHVQQFKGLLDLGSHQVRVVGICGMCGIGKTTLAMALCREIYHQYDACCYVDDVSKIYRDCGPIGVQKQFLCQALNEENMEICNLYEVTCTRLCDIKALIVLDNIDKVKQLETLPIKCEWLGAGSKVIIISRDEHILKKYEMDGVYNVQLLNWHNSLQLFCKKAFKHDDSIRDYKDLTNDVLKYANGLPLAIKVLGSFLFGRDISECRSALTRLRESPSKDIMDVLRISFDALEEEDKKIFLDIACFFHGHQEQYVKDILDCCGFHLDIGIRVLLDKSLITISDHKIEMHELLQELGKKIVRENSPKDPRKWSRLWLYKDFHNIMLENTAIEIPEAIVLQSHFGENPTLRAEVLSKMTRLRLLILNGVKISGSLNCLSNELRYIKWDKCTFTCLPSSFQADKLVRLILTDINIKQKDMKLPPNIRFWDLRHSKNLIKTPDFEETPNLGQQDLETTTQSLSISSIFKRLMTHFDFFYFSTHKDLAGCLLPSVPSFPCLRELHLSFCNLSQIPTAIACMRCLEILNLKGNNFVRLPCSLKELSKLVYLNLEHCKQLKSLPELPSCTDLPARRSIFWNTNRPGLYIFNCPKLGERESCRSMTFSWMIQVIKVNHESSASFSNIDIIAPGSQIPRWFNNQSDYCSIDIDLSPIRHGNNWIGIACCAVFVALDDPTNKYGGRKFHDIAIHFENIYGYGFSSTTHEVLVDLVTVNSDHSDHIWLFYVHGKEFLDSINMIIDGIASDAITMGITTYSLRLDVRNCGYRWVFRQDLEQLNPTKMPSGSSSSILI